MQTAHKLQLNFLLETSHCPKLGFDAQSDLGMLPPCRFEISKRCLRGEGSPEG
jgi:hypothetical protein